MLWARETRLWRVRSPLQVSARPDVISRVSVPPVRTSRSELVYASTILRPALQAPLCGRASTHVAFSLPWTPRLCLANTHSTGRHLRFPVLCPLNHASLPALTCSCVKHPASVTSRHSALSSERKPVCVE